MEYFDLLHTLTAPISVQYQSLCEASQKYQPGSQFGAFVRSVSMSPTNIPMKEDAFVFEPFISSRYICSYIIFVLCIIGCRVWVNILCENYEELDNCINFCFRESQRKTSGQSTGSSNDLQLQDESPLMGRNGIFCNLVHQVKIIRNRFFENAIYFSVLKKSTFSFLFSKYYILENYQWRFVFLIQTDIE